MQPSDVVLIFALLLAVLYCATVAEGHGFWDAAFISVAWLFNYALVACGLFLAALAAYCLLRDVPWVSFPYL